MNVWKVFGVKKWFILSLLALVAIWAAFIIALVFYFIFPSRIYIYLLVFLGLYGASSIYVLFKQSLFRFLKYRRMEGETTTGKIIYHIPSTGEESARPLAIIEINGVKRVVALVGIFGFSMKKRIKEGETKKIYQIKGEQIALLLVDH